jgi:exonuclease VII small subunit
VRYIESDIESEDDKDGDEPKPDKLVVTKEVADEIPIVDEPEAGGSGMNLAEKVAITTVEGTKRPRSPEEADDDTRPIKRPFITSENPKTASPVTILPDTNPDRKSSLQYLEEILVRIERNQDKYARDLQAVERALDDSQKAQRLLERANKEVEMRVEGMKKHRNIWDEDVAEMRYLARLGRMGIDLSEVEEKK